MDTTVPRETALAVRRAVLKWVARRIANALFRVEVEGRENFPQSGPLLVVSNHFHWSEPPLVALSTPWDIEFLGARAAMSIKGIGWIIRLYRTIPVEKMGLNADAIRRALDFLRLGKIVGVFPEGRTHVDHLSQPWPGAAFLALRSGAPLLPVGVEGGFEAPTYWHSRRRAPIQIRIGETFGPLHSPGANGKEALQWGTREIMSRIAALLPERMRGAF